MSKRINLEFWPGGGQDFLFSLVENKFFGYGRDRDLIHQKFGGVGYYTSNSWATGAGYIEPQFDQPLVKYGCYFTDKNAGPAQPAKVVHRIGERVIYGYAPVDDKQGLPVVLTDGYRKVAFVSKNQVVATLLGWDSIEWSQKEISSICCPSLDQETVCWDFYNPDKMAGVDASKFVDINELKTKTSDFLKSLEAEKSSFLCKKMDIYKCPKNETLYGREGHEAYGGIWLHETKNHLIDGGWVTDPSTIVGEIVDGWVGAGDGLFWKRKGLMVESFMEIVRDGKYVADGLGDRVEYEEEDYSLMEWFSKPIQKWVNFFKQKCLEKERADYLYARKSSGADTRRLMEKNLKVKFCLQDSLDTGNCAPGTNKFVATFGIKLDKLGNISVAKLLKCEEIERMLKIFEFQKVIHAKLDNLSEGGDTPSDDEVVE